MNQDETATQAEPFTVPDTIYGDVRDSLLAQVRTMETPWSKLSEEEQSDRIEGINKTAHEMVRQTVHAVAKRGFENIPIVVKDFTVKGGVLKGKFEATVNEPTVIKLSDNQERAAIIIMVNAGDFMNEQVEATPDPDSPYLPMEVNQDQAA